MLRGERVVVTWVEVLGREFEGKAGPISSSLMTGASSRAPFFDRKGPFLLAKVLLHVNNGERRLGRFLRHAGHTVLSYEELQA